MAKPTVRLNLKGINELMTSAPVQAELDRAGTAIARRAGRGHEYRAADTRHPWVARGYVATTDARAARENARSNTLLRALGGPT